MNSKAWLARTLFYLLFYLRGFAPGERRPKARMAQRSEPAPVAALKPLREAK